MPLVASFQLRRTGGVFVSVIGLAVQATAFAQTSGPFIGCPADGQAGPIAAPTGTAPALRLTKQAQERLAYFQSPHGLSVLAPRDWHCFALYGSGGDALFVSPDPLPTSSTNLSFDGPAITVSRRLGEASSRELVARMILLLFPSQRTKAEQLLQGFAVNGGPPIVTASDSLRRIGNAIVEFRTAPEKEGLGTTGTRLKPNHQPIRGAVVLAGTAPDVWHLAIRLPQPQPELEAAILRQFELIAEQNNRRR